MSIQRGKKCWEQIVEVQNKICVTEGEIQRNDTRIWEYLNRSTTAFDDKDWRDILEYFFGVVNVEHPDLVTAEDYELFAELVDVLPADPQGGAHTFYGKPYKSTPEKLKMWQAIMRMRELWNKIHGIDTRNRPGQTQKPTPLFNELFTEHH
jgi:hypothetical protein